MNSDIPQFGERLEKYTNRVGVYALVLNEQNELLVVDTERGPYLPGGGVDADEDRVEALKREVLEETGYELSSAEKLAEANQFAIHPKAGPVNKIGIFYLASINEKIPRVSIDQHDHESRWMALEDFLACETDEFHKHAVRQYLKQ